MRYLASPAQLRASVLRWALFTIPAVLGLGFLSGVVAGSGAANPWFSALVKPAIYPPPQTFGIAWTALYILMGLALAIVIAARGAPGRRTAVVAFVIQMMLNLAWSPAFFALHRISLALAIICALVIGVAVVTAMFWRVRRLAGTLLLPYLAWVCFAALLNLQILQLNPDADGAADPDTAVRVQL